MPDFDGLNLTPSKTEIWREINHYTHWRQVGSSGQDDWVALKFEGLVDIRQTGEWTFATNSDDGSNIWIGDKLVVNNDGTHGARERSGKIGLQAGLHAIRVEYFEYHSGAFIEVKMGGPGQPWGIIPPHLWKHASPHPPPAPLSGEPEPLPLSAYECQPGVDVAYYNLSGPKSTTMPNFATMTPYKT